MFRAGFYIFLGILIATLTFKADARAERHVARERAHAAPKNDWRSISPLCQSPFLMPGRVCCTYDPPYGTPRIICR